MTEQKQPISIWYFIGLLLTIYGVLITGAGVYDVVAGIQRDTVYAHLHAGVWWGALLIVIGVIYLHFFSPKRKKR